MKRENVTGYIRRAQSKDGEAIAQIYNAAVARGESVYRAPTLTAEQARDMLFGVPSRFECFAFEGPSGFSGWSGLLRYHDREAYQTTAELATYVTPQDRGQGIGRALVQHALDQSRELGFHTVVLLLQAKPSYLLAWAARLGFRYMGFLSGALPVGSEWRDILVFQHSTSPNHGGAR